MDGTAGAGELRTLSVRLGIHARHVAELERRARAGEAVPLIEALALLDAVAADEQAALRLLIAAKL